LNKSQKSQTSHFGLTHLRHFRPISWQCSAIRVR